MAEKKEKKPKQSSTSKHMLSLLLCLTRVSLLSFKAKTLQNSLLTKKAHALQLNGRLILSQLHQKEVMADNYPKGIS